MDFLLASSLLILFGLGGALYFWRKERRVLKSKTSEQMSRAVWNEIVEEREAALRRRRTFHEALKRAQKKS